MFEWLGWLAAAAAMAFGNGGTPAPDAFRDAMYADPHLTIAVDPGVLIGIERYEPTIDEWQYAGLVWVDTDGDGIDLLSDARPEWGP